MFDEEIDGLGFQVKEWPWHCGRDKHLAELFQGRNLACDQPWPAATARWSAISCASCAAGSRSTNATATMSLGQIVSHALEASCRTMVKGDTEREVASQLSHRLLHRGAMPMLISVAGDSPPPGLSAAELHGRADPRKLHAAGGGPQIRLVRPGQPIDVFRPARRRSFAGSTMPRARSAPPTSPAPGPTPCRGRSCMGGRRIFQLIGFEHEWLLSPQGHVTGWASLEKQLTPQTEELLENHTALSWQVSVGAALSADTFVLSEEGPKLITPIENWPVKRIRIQGAEFLRPDLLVRNSARMSCEIGGSELWGQVANRCQPACGESATDC